MDPVTITALIGAGVQLTALILDAYKKSGATPEEIATMKALAMARLEAAIAAVEASEPPPIGAGA